MNSLNKKALRTAINESGLTITSIAERIGISRETLYNKMEKKSEFSASEICAMQAILGISNAERDAIFFGN